MRSDLFSPSLPFVETFDRAAPITDGSDVLQAAAWLRANSTADDLVVTNVTAWPTVPAVTNLQTLASGVRYQAPYGLSSMIEPLLERERMSWEFLQTPSALTAANLCAHPVSWLFVDTAVVDKQGWEPWASVEFESGSIEVLRWNTDQC